MPTLTLQPDGTTGIDTYISQSNTTLNYGASQTLVAGQVGDSLHRALIKFDLSSLPAGAIIQSATLRLRCTAEASSADITFWVRRSLVEWYEGSKNGAEPDVGQDGSTYNHRNANGSVSWGAAGGQAGTDFASSDTDSTTITNAAAFYDWDVTADVDDFHNGVATNHGWWIGTNSITTNGAKVFASSDYTVSEAARPQLIIEYLAPDEMSGSAAGSATVSGSLVGRIYLSGQSAGSATVTGAMVTNAISGSTAGSATVTGTLSARGYLAGQSAGEAAASGDLLGGGMLSGSTGGQASVTATAALHGILRGSATGVATATGRVVGYARHVATPRLRNPAPLLEITDGVNTLNLLDPRAIQVCRWRPAIAQYKAGGQWSDSPQAHGRRLKQRRFANTIEVFEFDTSGKDQDEAIAHFRELVRFLEAAADYWTSSRATRPIYVRARSAYEEHTRYSIVHAGSVPELADVLEQPFFTARGRSVLGSLTLRLERGPWLDNPPGVGSCVEVSSIRNWTVTGWSSSDTGGGGGGGATVSGDVRAMVQAANGDIIIGTNDAASFYRSSDEGQTWTFVTSLGTSTDSINALAKDSAGNLYAAVTGGASAQGIWRSTNNGASWTRVKSHPNNTGYYDIAIFQNGSRIVAVGDATPLTDSPVIYSTNQGATWINVSPRYDKKHIAVATIPDPVLYTNYPGETSPTAAFFAGVDSFYTEMWGVTNTLSVVGFSTVGGGAGNGGLDMAAFLFKNSSGSYNRRALWAVKSHLNTANTEIWQWPASPTGPFSFAKIATISGEVFNVLYVDPVAWPNIGAERTIWAGADGKIFVSYNSGLTWSLATAAPTNQVRCFLRTAAGTLIAGCDNAEIFLFGSGSGSEGGGAGSDDDEESEAGGSEIVNSQPLGRAATCEDEVYVANKSSFSNVTHVLYYDGSSYSEVQFANEPPYDLLGDPPASGDAVYFGIATGDTNVPNGTFSSLIFDITQIAEDVTVVWEYWDGDEWAALDVQDNSSGFRIGGVQSVHWIIPSDWVTTSVNSITGYWVRARVSVVGGSPVGPVHDNRYIYTANLPYVEIAEREIGGEMPALAQVIWSNQADNTSGDPDMDVHRLLVGLRSCEETTYFDAYLNLSDKQVPFGVTVTALEGGFENSVVAPTARRYSVSYSSSGDLNAWTDLVRISLSTTIARDYYGSFRAFLRGYIAGGDADDWKFRLALGFGSGGVVSYSREQYGKPVQVDFRLFDMGSIHIPNATLGELISDELTITVQGYATATNVAAKLYDLILLPLDEWAGDFVHTNLTNANIPSAIEGGNYLDIDSITNPKTPLGVYNRLQSGLVKAIYQPITNGEAILQVKRRQRLWFLAAQYAFASSSWGALPTAAGRVRVNKVQQYLGMRGAG